MKIVKQAQGGQSLPVTAEQLEQINRFARRELKAEEVYSFSVRLCDNEVDRDGERFPRRTLEELAELFVGKSGLFDHSWSARGQAARIYAAQVVQEERLTRTGEPYCWLKGCAYMVRTADNESLIREIEGGIKKEVSVGCAVERRVCSVCGQVWDGSCGHEAGKTYDGTLCCVELEHATDAYEFSFVAVPAQPEAGVVKGRGAETDCLKELVKGKPHSARQLKQLEEQAALGRAYLEQLRGDAVRLARLADKSLEPEVITAMVKGLDGEQLTALKQSLEARAADKYPIRTQLPYAPGEGERDREHDRAFLI